MGVESIVPRLVPVPKRHSSRQPPAAQHGGKTSEPAPAILTVVPITPLLPKSNNHLVRVPGTPSCSTISVSKVRRSEEKKNLESIVPSSTLRRLQIFQGHRKGEPRKLKSDHGPLTDITPMLNIGFRPSNELSKIRMTPLASFEPGSALMNEYSEVSPHDSPIERFRRRGSVRQRVISKFLTLRQSKPQQLRNSSGTYPSTRLSDPHPRIGPSTYSASSSRSLSSTGSILRYCHTEVCPSLALTASLEVVKMVDSIDADQEQLIWVGVELHAALTQRNEAVDAPAGIDVILMIDNS